MPSQCSTRQVPGAASRLGVVARHLVNAQPAQISSTPTARAASFRWLRSLSSKTDAASDVVLTSSPTELGLDTLKLQAAYDYMASLVDEGKIPGACVAVGRGTQRLRVFTVGVSGPEAGEINQGLTGGMALEEDSIFLVASVTKPVVTTAVTMCSEYAVIRSWHTIACLPNLNDR
eukprot:SAG31_NODE_7618_length_1639_cov_0.986364_3_plen_175_part_00